MDYYQQEMYGMTKDLQKKYRQDEWEKVDQNIQVLEEQFETPFYSRSWR